MEQTLFCDLNFWSAVSGLVGTVIIFFFGLPPKVDIDGHDYLILQGENKEEKQKAKIFKYFSYFGLFLLALSFFLQIIKII